MMRGNGWRHKRSAAVLSGGYQLLLIWVAFAFFALTTPAAAANERRLEPSGPWQLNKGEQSCTLTRGFGSGEASLVLVFERFSPGDLFQLLITSKLIEGSPENPKMAIEYGPGGFVDEREYVLGRTADGTPSAWISSSTLAYRGKSSDGRPVVSPTQETAIQEISFSPSSGNKLVLRTGSLGRAFAALRNCTDDLVVSWGLDPDQQRNLTRLARPKGPPSAWIQNSDYPRNMLPSGSLIIVNFRLMVDRNGKPERCQITRSYFGDQFDKLSCDLLLRRASFDPALDAKGEKIRSYYVNTIRWVR